MFAVDAGEGITAGEHNGVCKQATTITLPRLYITKRVPGCRRLPGTPFRRWVPSRKTVPEASSPTLLPARKTKEALVVRSLPKAQYQCTTFPFFSLCPAGKQAKHCNCFATLLLPFHFQEWSISNFPCSLIRNTTSHGIKNVAFHSLLRGQVIVLPILTTLLVQISLTLSHLSLKSTFSQYF